MKTIAAMLLALLAGILPVQVMASGEPGVAAEWYFPAWMGSAPHAPVFQLRDTENKYGRIAVDTKSITIKDLIRYHGHFCGGLVESAASLRLAFDLLFQDGTVDRTDLDVVSNNSACGGDVAEYLTGARARFGAHVIDPKLTESEFYLRRRSTGRIVHVRLNPAVYPKEVKAQMRKIESGTFETEDVDRFQELQWAYARRIVENPLKESFLSEEVQDYAWPLATCQDLGKRKDNDYKNVPRR